MAVPGSYPGDTSGWGPCFGDMNLSGQSCLPSERRRRLSLLAAEDLARFEREATLRARGRSIATWIADLGFWLVYGGGMALVAYIAFCAPGR